MAAEAVRFASDICIFAGASEGVLQRTRPQAGTRARSGGAGYYARASFAGTRPSPGRSLKLAYAGPPPTPHVVQERGTLPLGASRGSAPSEARHPRAWVRSGVPRVGIRAGTSPTRRAGMQRVALPRLRYCTREVRVSSQAASKRATKETGECQRSWRERSSAPPERARVPACGRMPKRIPSPPPTVISVEADTRQACSFQFSILLDAP